MTHRDRLADLYKHIIANDAASISALFPGPVSIDTPLSGAADDIQGLDRLLNEEGDWLRMSDATATSFAITEDDRRVIIEFIVDLNHQGQPVSLPVAVFGQKHEQGFGQIRIYHSTWPLVLFQGDIAGFSVPVVFCGQAQCAGNGCSLAKHGNAAARHHRSARRVALSAPMAALRLLQRTKAIRCETRLAMNADRPTEPGNITLKEY